MGYFNMALSHASTDKRNKGMNSTTNEKGTDGKRNNSSEYNHQYYMKNKDKWEDGSGAKYSEYDENDSDWSDEIYSKRSRLGNTDFQGVKKADGSWVIFEEDMKWSLPKGVEVNKDTISRLEAFEKEVAKRRKDSNWKTEDWRKMATDAINGKSSTEEFDVDAAADDVIRGKYGNGEDRKKALGDDYSTIQKRVNEKMGGKEESSPKRESTKSTNSSPKEDEHKKKINDIARSFRHSYFYDQNDYLEHHGIKGQKWGIRRFQRKDGTRTPAGRRREARREVNEAKSNKKRDTFDAKAFGKGAAIAGTVALGAALVINPSSRNLLTKYGKTALSGIKDVATSDKTKDAVKNFAKKTGKSISKSANRVGNAMLDAALLSAGGIAISKINQKFADDENATENEKYRNQILRDTLSGGVKELTKTKSGGNSKTYTDNKGTHVGKDISDKIGPPSNQNIDRSSKAWQDLFKDQNGNQRDADTRSTIKSMANAGYDIEQIDRWLNHSALKEWADSFYYLPKFRR